LSLDYSTLRVVTALKNDDNAPTTGDLTSLIDGIKSLKW
jgi:hypothetical protein